MIDSGYFQPNFLIYSTDVLFHMIFRVKSSKTKFSAKLVYEEETVQFQHPSSLKSKQYIGSWAKHIPKPKLLHDLRRTLPPSDFSQFSLRKCLAKPHPQPPDLNPDCKH